MRICISFTSRCDSFPKKHGQVFSFKSASPCRDASSRRLSLTHLRLRSACFRPAVRQAESLHRIPKFYFTSRSRSTQIDRRNILSRIRSAFVSATSAITLPTPDEPGRRCKSSRCTRQSQAPPHCEWHTRHEGKSTPTSACRTNSRTARPCDVATHKSCRSEHRHSTAGNLQHFAHHDDRPTRTMLVDPGGNARALHPGSTLPRRCNNPLPLVAGVFR